MPKKSPDAVLAQKAREGDHAAFTELIELHKSSLEGFVVGYLGKERDAGDAVDDAISEAHLKAWENIATFNAKASFSTWLRSIAKNVCLDILDSRKQTPNWQDGERDDEDSVHPWDRGELIYLDPDSDGLDDAPPPSLEDYVEMIKEIEFERDHILPHIEDPAVRKSEEPWLNPKELSLLKEVAKRTPRTEIAKMFKMTPSALNVALHRIKNKS